MRSNKKRYESPWLTFRKFSDDREIVRTSGGNAKLTWGEWGNWEENRDNTYIQGKEI